VKLKRPIQSQPQDRKKNKENEQNEHQNNQSLIADVPKTNHERK
jgi:hypothetical protein